MNAYINQALAFERMERYQAEAENYRRMKAARSQQPGPRERIAQAIGRGLASIGESIKIDRRPRHAI